MELSEFLLKRFWIFYSLQAVRFAHSLLHELEKGFGNKAREVKRLL
jgi:hypothetical protein